MKNLSWKKISLIALLFVGTTLAILYFQKNRSKATQTIAVNPAFAEYVSFYTAGMISSKSSIKVILASDVVESSMVGEVPSQKLFNFSPSIDGTARWADTRTIVFEPSSRLRAGEFYKVEFFLSKLMTVPDELNTLEYTFQVTPQSYEIAIENVKPYIKTELARQKIEGILYTADFAENEWVEKMINAQQEKKPLTISWEHSVEGKEHKFIVEDVARKEKASLVELAITGKKIGVDKNESLKIDIPALGDFKITNVKVEQNNNQHVVLQFSDPLNETQILDGLIDIDQAGTLDFEIKDNEIRVYPPVRQIGTKTLTVEAGIKNILNYKMPKRVSFDVVFEQTKPAIRFIGKGQILPGTDGLVIPFEAVSLKAVDVEILKIYEKNILQFLQINNIEGERELYRVGKTVLRKTISLENFGVSDLGKWNRFTIDMSSLVNTEPGAIYQVKLTFNQSYSVYSCGNNNVESSNENPVATEDTSEDYEEEGEEEESYWDASEDTYNSDYNWSDRDNPCSSSYYMGDQRTIKRNIIASDLGIIAKQGGDNNTYIFVTDLKTTQPLSGITVELYDYQQQLVGSATTDADGKAVISTIENPFFLLAKNGTQRGYLKLQDGESLSVSNFDVGGEYIQRGLKGFIYGERGVWRPGDSLFVSFILEDKFKIMPANHPVVFELQNPQGQVTNRLVKSTSENGFYLFSLATDADAPTGNWTARIKAGGNEFSYPIRIETVKPNRLKINLDFGVAHIAGNNSDISGKLNVKWLHGTPGKNLKAEFDVFLSPTETKFKRYPDFIFDDPSRNFVGENQRIFEGSTDNEGNATVNTSINVSENAPGMLTAIFRGKVFEESGEFSTDRFSIPLYPYKSFTGIRLPLGDKARGMLLTDTTHRVDLVTLDPNGNPVSRNNINMTIYKLDWRWWWDKSENGANFISTSSRTPLQSGQTKTVNGKGSWTFRVNYPDWGRYLVVAHDTESGHSTGKVVYIDWPGWAGRARGGNEGATMLAFSSDKTTYNIGENATIVIPGSDKGRALVSIENGSRVINTYWLETNKGDNKFSFEITEDMTPNVFVHVTLLQPHAQTINDLPIRLYGVIPIQAEDPQTHLAPVITMPDVLEPGQKVTINVSEEKNRKMTYTLAVVEEGLLDLTKYKTPNPWSRFYAREALGVKTWDLYDQIIGSYGGNIERLLAIGGDDEGAEKEGGKKANRFKPVIKFFGPFTMDGKSNQHTFTMPQYIGSVKTMLVAGYEGAYGNTEKTTPVRKPLMVLATLPRVLGPEEKVKMPITLFSMDDRIKDVKIQIKTTGPVSLPSGAVQSVTMSGSDMVVDFDLAVKSETGVAQIEVVATSGSYKATSTLELDVRNANPPVTKVIDTLIEPGSTWTGGIAPVGISGTNTALLEISSMPPINLDQRLKYLLQYPYGCIEQTTSSVFPQLYIDRVRELSDEEKKKVQQNIKAGIERLKLFVTNDGGFSYWPGSGDADSWGSTYAGHFLIEASATGYFVPSDLMKQWRNYQRNKAQLWRKNQEQSNSELIQAYRLYTLALVADPELGAMNRLREQAELPHAAKWMLAAAYIKAGQPEAAKKLIDKVSTSIKPYQEMAYSYGSDLRDKAIIAEVLLMLDNKQAAFNIIKEISVALSNENYWMSTQTTAWCLKSVGEYAKGIEKGKLKFSYTYNGKKTDAGTELPIAQVALPIIGLKKGDLKIENTSKGTVFVKIINRGTPARGIEDTEEKNLSLQVEYTDTEGNSIDPTKLEQGTEFVASVTVTNPGMYGHYKNIVLNQIFPSGWEINNLRLDNAEGILSGDKPTYRDIRDDRVYTFFDLNANQKKTFQVMLTAAYAGSYYLPAVSCEAMYNNTIYARLKGQSVEVVKAGLEK